MKPLCEELELRLCCDIAPLVVAPAPLLPPGPPSLAIPKPPSVLMPAAPGVLLPALPIHWTVAP